MYFTFSKSTSIMDEDLEGTDKIRPQYAHERMYDVMTQKIPLSCFRKRMRKSVRVTANVYTCWRVPGACMITENHQAYDGVTSMMNAFDRDNAMLGRITFWRT